MLGKTGFYQIHHANTTSLVSAYRIGLTNGHWDLGKVFRDRGISFEFQTITTSREERMLMDYDGSIFHGEAWIDCTDEKGTYRIAWCRWSGYEDWSWLEIHEGDEFLRPLFRGGR